MSTSSQAAVVALHAATSASFPENRSLSISFAPLQRLEFVRVVKKVRRNGHRLYVIGVFLQRNAARCRLSESVYKPSPASKLSPETMHDFMTTEREPDYVVERRFTEFRQLRNNTVMLMRTNGAHVKACADCQNLLRAMLSSSFHNWTVKRMFSNKEQRFALLTAFVNDLLTSAAGADEFATNRSTTKEMEKDCEAREQVMEMLQKFLKRSYQPSLGII